MWFARLKKEEFNEGNNCKATDSYIIVIIIIGAAKKNPQSLSKNLLRLQVVMNGYTVTGRGEFEILSCSWQKLLWISWWYSWVFDGPKKVQVLSGVGMCLRPDFQGLPDYVCLPDVWLLHFNFEVIISPFWSKSSIFVLESIYVQPHVCISCFCPMVQRWISPRMFVL